MGRKGDAGTAPTNRHAILAEFAAVITIISAIVIICIEATTRARLRFEGEGELPAAAAAQLDIVVYLGVGMIAMAGMAILGALIVFVRRAQEDDIKYPRFALAAFIVAVMLAGIDYPFIIYAIGSYGTDITSLIVLGAALLMYLAVHVLLLAAMTLPYYRMGGKPLVIVVLTAGPSMFVVLPMAATFIKAGTGLGGTSARVLDIWLSAGIFLVPLVLIAVLCYRTAFTSKK